MRITKRSPIRRMVREIEKLWEGPGGFEEMSPEELAEYLSIVAVYLDRTLFRVGNLQQRIELTEKKLSSLEASLRTWGAPSSGTP